MFRIITVITIVATFLSPLLVLRCNCAALVQSSTSSDPQRYGLTSKSKAKDVLPAVSDGRGKAKDKDKNWAEIIGVLTVAQSEPLPSLYTFLINEYEGDDVDDGFVRQSACFQEAEKMGNLASYRTPCIDTSEELGRRSGNMSFEEFMTFQNRVRGMLWQEENRMEQLARTKILTESIVPLQHTMYLTYPDTKSERIDLVVVAESNGVNSTAIPIASSRSNRKIERVKQQQQLFIRDYRRDGKGFRIKPYVPLLK